MRRRDVPVCVRGGGACVRGEKCLCEGGEVPV